MTPAARLLLPPPALAGCVFAAIERDTRGAALDAQDRVNHFPASPLIALTRVLDGTLYFVTKDEGKIPVPPLSVMGAQSVPSVSTSDDDVHVLTIAFFPDAWLRLTGEAPQTFQDQIRADIPDIIAELFARADGSHSAEHLWQQFCDALLPVWQEMQMQANWSGKDRLTAWTHALFARAIGAGRGKSLRAIERRLRSWSGQTQQSLEFYARFEKLHQLSIEEKDAPLAALAHEAGFADQSHMGRTVRRATGYSPAKLNRLIETEESFWCYRLLGERF